MRNYYKNDNIRKHLLTNRVRTFAKAEELSLSLEAAENQALELKPIVHRVESSRQSTTILEEQTTTTGNVSSNKLSVINARRGPHETGMSI